MTKKVIWSAALILVIIVTAQDIYRLFAPESMTGDVLAFEKSAWATIPASIVSLISSVLGAFLLVAVCTYLIYGPFYLLRKRSWLTQKIIAAGIGGLIFVIMLSGAVRPYVEPAHPERMSYIEQVFSGFLARLIYFSLEGAFYVLGALILISIIGRYQKKSEAAGA